MDLICKQVLESIWNWRVNLLNFIDFDYTDDRASNWDAMNEILGDSLTVGGYATAIDAEGEGFIQLLQISMDIILLLLQMKVLDTLLRKISYLIYGILMD